MAINYELLNKGGISLGTNFELLSEKPLDSRLVVPSLDGLQNYIDNAAAYEGLIAYVSSEKKHYEVKVIDGVLSYRPFGLTEAELNDLITNSTTAAMEFKGATATLPENPAKGDMYKVAGENINIKIDDVDAKLGDSIVYDGEKWFLIPSGDDIEDTWRPVDGVNNDATLKFVNGDKTVAAVAADGTIKYNHATVDAPELLAENEQTRTYITAVETDGYGHITGYKTATENVEDTNTEYTFESQVESSSVYFQVTPNTEGATEQTVYVDAYSKNETDGKFVAKVEGKSLVSDTEIARLANVDNYNDEELRGLIGDNAKAIEDLETYVGTIPTDDKYKDLSVVAYIDKKAEETLAAAQGGSSETAASVKQQLDNYKSANDTRVKAVEDNVAAINNAETGILKQAKDYADGLAGNYDEAGAAAGVQAALEAEIAKKVAKAEGKDLIATSEIERLATLHNYDDTQVKADIAKKADAETMTTELGKKVDKVEGYSLVSDVEIERLGTLRNYDDTALAGRVSTAEGKIAALETESAKHALKTELETVDKKFANYKTAEAQKAIDDEQDRRLGVIEGDYLKAADIANFETKENVKKVADDLAEYVESNDAALDLVRQTADAARTEGEVNDQIDAKITALNLGATYEPIGAEQRAKNYVDGKFTDANLAQYTTEQEVKDIVDGVIAGAVDGDAITGLANLVEYINTHGGEAAEMGAAIDVLEGKVETIEGKPAYGITATQISNWDGEVGAKALAETKTTTAEVKDQIEAYGYATTGYADDKADAAKDAAIADAAGKYETKGTAQGIVDGLKLSETYEPIGAEGRAIAAAKTETENQVKALADGQVTTNKNDISSIMELLTWGSF